MSLSNLTAREQEVLVIAIQRCLQNPDALKIDYELLREHAGFTAVRSASNIWGDIRRKLLTGYDNAGNTTNSNGGDTGTNADVTTTGNATPKKRGRKPAARGANKRAKKGGKKGEVAAQHEEDDDEGLVGVKKEGASDGELEEGKVFPSVEQEGGEGLEA